MIEGKRFAILGLGRSAQAVARVVQDRGGSAVCLDEKSTDSADQVRAVDFVQGLGAEAVTGWHGQIDSDAHDLLVVSPGFPAQHPAIRAMQEAGKPVWGEIEFAFRIARRPIFAISGTNGKSTVTALVHALIPGSTLAGNIFGSGLEEVTLTEAAAMDSNSPIVAEVSSFQLESIVNFRPSVASITNITPDHIDRHGSFESYRDAKLRLVMNMEPEDVFVVPGWDPELEEHIVALNSAVRIARASVRDLPALKLPGEIGRRNAALALAIASQGPIAADAERILSEFPGLEHRLEWLGEIEGVEVFNNSMCTNPAAFINSGNSFDRPLHILAGGNAKGIDFHSVREWLAETGHGAYLFNADSASLRGDFGDYPVFESMREAFEQAMANARSGEVVVLMPGCRSAPPYTDFRARGEAFRLLFEEAKACAV